MKIIDIFLFFNEINLLELRLREHDSFVDTFVIIESRKTFTNNDKPLFFEIEKFLQWKDKIIHIVIDELQGNNSWEREYYSRNYGLTKLREIGNPSDWIINTDLDEIVKKETIGKLTEPQIYSLEMDFYYYNCNWMKKVKWRKGTIGPLSKITSLQECRNNSGTYPVLKSAGWHLSYFLTPEDIRKKIESFSHTEYNNEQYKSLENIQKSINLGTDLFQRGNCEELTLSNEELPENISCLPKMFQRNRYSFTNEWFSTYHREQFDKFLLPLSSNANNFLEVGVHEGRSATWVIDHYLENLNSKLYLIDPYLSSDITTPVDQETRNRFIKNLSISKYPEKVQFFEDLSGNILPKLFVEGINFDVIYIDGSHLNKDVLHDAVLAEKILNSGGLLIFDDYDSSIKSTLDYFVNTYKDFEILHQGYILILKKR